MRTLEDHLVDNPVSANLRKIKALLSANCSQISLVRDTVMISVSGGVT